MRPGTNALFVPWSGPTGTGEFVRSLTIAQCLQSRWPELRVRFVLNRHAPYAGRVPFETHFIDDSPTYSTSEVQRILREDPPSAVVFDCAGRAAALSTAREGGSRVVYISRRPGRRRKAFRRRGLTNLDQHWMAFPAFIDRPLGVLERLKLWMHPSVEVVFLGSVFHESEPTRRAALRKKLGLDGRPFVLFSPGGGGTRGKGPQAPDVFALAALRVTAEAKVGAVVVAGQNYEGELGSSNGVTLLRSLRNDEIIDLIHDARVAVVNGGTTLPQVLAHGRASVAVPLATDQHRRIRRCHRRGLTWAAPLDVAGIAERVLRLVGDDFERSAMEQRVRAAGVGNGLGAAVDSLSRLLRDGALPRLSPTEGPSPELGPALPRGREVG